MLSFLQKMIDHLSQIRVLQIRVLQIRVLQIHVLQIRVLQIRVLQIRVLQIRVLQIQSVFYKSNPVPVLQYALETEKFVVILGDIIPSLSQPRRRFTSSDFSIILLFVILNSMF